MNNMRFDATYYEHEFLSNSLATIERDTFFSHIFLLLYVLYVGII